MELELLKSFCDDGKKYPLREELIQPFSRGNFSFGCSRILLVRVPRLAEIPEHPASPMVESLFEKIPADCSFTPLVYSAPPKSAADCPSCRGLGAFLKCQGCRGLGHRSCAGCGHEKDCPDCKGNGSTASRAGEIKCERCVDGKIESPRTTEVNGALFNVALLDKIAVLPGVEMGVMADKLEAHPFRFRGGDGLLMPMRK